MARKREPVRMTEGKKVFMPYQQVNSRSVAGKHLTPFFSQKPLLPHHLFPMPEYNRWLRK